jgi:hypothetical protein
MLHAGYDLAYAWPETLRELRDATGAELRAQLTPPTEGFAAFVHRLAQIYPEPAHRLWLGVLAELYATGAPLSPTLAAFLHALGQEQDRDWQAHLRGVPLRVSLVLAVFFLLPALALVFVPLLMEMAETFQ